MLREILGVSRFAGKSRAGADFVSLTLHTSYDDPDVKGTAVSTVVCYGPSAMYDQVDHVLSSATLPIMANVDFDQRGRFVGFTPVE